MAAYVAQLVVTFSLTYLIRRNLLSSETVERLRATPELQSLIGLVADGVTLFAIAVQGWVTTSFVKVSGQIAQKKLEVIGNKETALVNAAAGIPTSTNTLNIKTDQAA